MNDLEQPALDESADPAVDESAIRAEVESTDPGGFARDEDERILHRYMRRRFEALATITHLKEQTAAMLRGLENKLKGLDFVYLAYAEQIARRKITGKTKSLRTPFGTVGFRTVKPLLQVVDEAAAIRALEALPGTQDCVRVEKSVVKSQLDLYYKNTGALPDGCDIRPGMEKFYVD